MTDVEAAALTSRVLQDLYPRRLTLSEWRAAKRDLRRIWRWHQRSMARFRRTSPLLREILLPIEHKAQGRRITANLHAATRRHLSRKVRA